MLPALKGWTTLNSSKKIQPTSARWMAEKRVQRIAVVAPERSLPPRDFRTCSLDGRLHPRCTPPSPPRTLPLPGPGPVCSRLMCSGPVSGLDRAPGRTALQPEARQRGQAWEAPAANLAVPPGWGPPSSGPLGLASVPGGGRDGGGKRRISEDVDNRGWR